MDTKLFQKFLCHRKSMLYSAVRKNATYHSQPRKSLDDLVLKRETANFQMCVIALSKLHRSDFIIASANSMSRSFL